MIHTTSDFYNKVADDIKAKYFPVENWGNPNYQAANYAIELFNNGCSTYRQFMSKLAKACGDSTHNIHSIVEKHITSFGEYQYQPTQK